MTVSAWYIVKYCLGTISTIYLHKTNQLASNVTNQPLSKPGLAVPRIGSFTNFLTANMQFLSVLGGLVQIAWDLCVPGPISWEYHVHGNKKTTAHLESLKPGKLMKCLSTLLSYKTQSATTDLKRTDSNPWYCLGYIYPKNPGTTIVYKQKYPPFWYAIDKKNQQTKTTKQLMFFAWS